MSLADGVSFTAASAGTVDFVFSAARASFRTPVQAHSDGSLVNGQSYSYLAQDSLTNPTQREWGDATYTAATQTFARSPTGGVDNGVDTGATKVNFAVPPVVSLTILAEDIFSSLAVGSTAVSGGTSGDALTDNGGMLGQKPIRTILTADTNYYVSITGSDSNGGTNPTTDAWATVQHAANFIGEAIDFSGFTVTVNIGSGSFPGMGLPCNIGGGTLNFYGAGILNTTLTDPGLGLGVVSTLANSDTTIFLDAFTIDSIPSQWGLYYDHVVILAVSNANLSNTFRFICSGGGASSHVGIFSPGAVFLGGTITIGAGSVQYVIQCSTGAVLNDFATYDVTNNITLVNAAATIECDSGGLFVEQGFGGWGGVGTITGKRFLVVTAGSLASPFISGMGPNYFPGTVPGTCDASSNYDGFNGPLSGINTQTGAAYTLGVSDSSQTVEMNNAGANTVTVPTNATAAIMIGVRIHVTQIGAGATSIVGAVGVTIRVGATIGGQYQSVTLYKRDTNEWVQTQF